MTRIAFWTNYPGGGGSEVLWNQVAEKLVGAGHTVFGSLYNSPANAGFLELMRATSMKVDLRSRKKESLPERALRRLGRARKPGPSAALLAFEPELVVINSDSYAWVADEALGASLDALQAPYIVVLHGTGGFFEDDVRARARERYTGARKVCFVSNYTRQMVTRHLAADLPNACVIRNPVHPKIDAANPPAFPPLEGPLVLATASRLNCYTKGHDYLLQAFASDEIRRQDFVCRIYNDGPHRRLLGELIAYYGLEKRVTLEGHSPDITAIWRGAHVHVMPSLVESAPIALVEAMLCARPTVASKSSGIPEWLVEGENGFMVESINTWNLVPGLLKAFESRDRLAELGRAAHQRAREMMGEPVGDFIRLLGVSA